MERPCAWDTYNDDQLAELEELGAAYRRFISDNKTERECCATSVELAEKAGYINLEALIGSGKKIKAGDKIYASNRGKALLLCVVGKRPFSEGANILGAHIDSPRLDVKQNPLEERDGIATLDTHYYGGIKKYQWVTVPLAIHGVIAKKDGTQVSVAFGEAEDDPVFVVSDLLVHLASEQMGKKAAEVVEGELLDVIVGNRPIKVTEGDEAPKDRVVTGVLSFLADELGMDESDFLSAELEVVPAGAARDMGFDRSMILGYGQDDRSCAYTSLVAQLECESPERAALTLLVDKEEIGSVGATGMHSRFFENAMAEIMELAGEGGELALRRFLSRSRMLSSDVSAGYDPSFASVFEKKNAAFLGYGLCFNKYTGSRGKSGSNDADAEYMALIRRCMDDAGVVFQTCELGRVDAGGGGTIAYIMANYGMQVIDCGVAVLSMHSPWEVTSKADLYEAVRGYRAFLQLA